MTDMTHTQIEKYSCRTPSGRQVWSSHEDLKSAIDAACGHLAQSESNCIFLFEEERLLATVDYEFSDPTVTDSRQVGYLVYWKEIPGAR